jgi:hypothetical protein
LKKLLSEVKDMLLEIGGEKPANMKEGSEIRWDGEEVI